MPTQPGDYRNMSGALLQASYATQLRKVKQEGKDDIPELKEDLHELNTSGGTSFYTNDEYRVGDMYRTKHGVMEVVDVKTPDDLGKSRGGPSAASMREKGVKYSVYLKVKDNAKTVQEVTSGRLSAQTCA